MTAPVITIELRPSAELMLVLDVLDVVARSVSRLADAIEASNRTAGPVATDQHAVANSRAPGAGEGAEHASPVPTEYPRGGGQAAAVMSSTPVKATTVVLEEPAKSPANALVAPVDRATAERPPVSGKPSTQPVMFSPDRNEIICREWPKGTPVGDILSMIHALPGAPVEARRLGIHAAGKLGVKRPAAQAPAVPVVTMEPAKVDLTPLVALGTVMERKPAPAAPPPAPKPVAAPQPKSRIEALAAVSKAISEKPPVDSGEPVFAGFEHVRRWAGERGVPFSTWDDLPAVNSRRERLGLPRFKREFAAKGVFG